MQVSTTVSFREFLVIEGFLEDFVEGDMIGPRWDFILVFPLTGGEDTSC